MGIFERMMTGLDAEPGEEKTVVIDATYLKAYRTATRLGVKKGGVDTCFAKPKAAWAFKLFYRGPNTSKPAPGHEVFPYLLRKLAVTPPNQVWAVDITYIPMARGFVYLVAVRDWFSRKVFAWRLSTTLETGPCIEALKEAVRRHGKPEIMSTDSHTIGASSRVV